MVTRLTINTLSVVTVMSLLFTGCTYTASDTLSAEIASQPEGKKLLEFDLTQCGEFLGFTQSGFSRIDLIASCGRQGILEASTESTEGLYYLYNMDTEEIDLIGQVDLGIVSSATDVFMEDGSFATTDLFLGDDGKLYRTVLLLDTNGPRILESAEIGQDEFPFVYLHKMSETQFLATEIEPTKSEVKKFDLETGTITTLLSYPYCMEDDSQKSGNVLRDALISGNSMYALLLTLDSQECYEINQYDLDGNYISTLDSSAAKRFFAETPYHFIVLEIT